ncbi:MAG: metallophosphoesterase [Candidatus Brocadiia bacterium]
MMVVIYILAGLLAAGTVLAAYMIFVEPRRFRIDVRTIPLVDSRSPGQLALEADRFPEMQILHISDTHFGIDDAAKLRFLRDAAGRDYDLAILTGDLIDAPAGIEPCLELAEMLSARLGTYAVLGGHDYFRSRNLIRKFTTLRHSSAGGFQNCRKNPAEKLRRELLKRDVEVLSDDNCRLATPDGRHIAIVGLRDSFVFDCDYRAAWDGVSPDLPTIVLAHSPDVLPEVSRRRAEMAFFGHTHGGQVRLPGIGAVVTRSNLETARASGIHREKDTVFVINRGVGAGWGSNFRLLCRPEVGLITVQKQTEEQS